MEIIIKGQQAENLQALLDERETLTAKADRAAKNYKRNLMTFEELIKITDDIRSEMSRIDSLISFVLRHPEL